MVKLSNFKYLLKNIQLDLKIVTFQTMNIIFTTRLKMVLEVVPLYSELT